MMGDLEAYFEENMHYYGRRRQRWTEAIEAAGEKNGGKIDLRDYEQILFVWARVAD